MKCEDCGVLKDEKPIELYEDKMLCEDCYVDRCEHCLSQLQGHDLRCLECEIDAAEMLYDDLKERGYTSKQKGE